MSWEELTDAEPRTFGPGTDLVFSLAAVLLLILALQTGLHRQEEERLTREKGSLEQELEEHRRHQLDLEQILESQRRLVDTVAAQFSGVEPVEEAEGVFALDIDHVGSSDLTFYNEATLQRITFGSHILFAPDETELSAAGEHLLSKIAGSLQAQGATLREIHIQGHADTSPTRHESNLHLAALRAISVFNELQRLGLDPAQIQMSATSFGEFLPVQRFQNPDVPYDWQRIARDNRTNQQKRLNRRIEMLLVYRTPAGATPSQR